MTKISLIALAVFAIAAQSSFADSTTTTPTVAGAQARMQTYQNMTPAQQEMAQQQAKSTMQQKQQNWNSMTPAQQQAQQQAMKTKMQGRMSGMSGGMSGMGGMGGMNGRRP